MLERRGPHFFQSGKVKLRSTVPAIVSSAKKGMPDEPGIRSEGALGPTTRTEPERVAASTGPLSGGPVPEWLIATDARRSARFI